jgi:hypothetical protein
MCNWGATRAELNPHYRRRFWALRRSLGDFREPWRQSFLSSQFHLLRKTRRRGRWFIVSGFQFQIWFWTQINDSLRNMTLDDLVRNGFGSSPNQLVFLERWLALSFLDILNPGWPHPVLLVQLWVPYIATGMTGWEDYKQAEWCGEKTVCCDMRKNLFLTAETGSELWHFLSRWFAKVLYLSALVHRNVNK